MAKHFANYRGEEHIVLGYSPTMNHVMLLRTAAMSGPDALEVRKHAISEAGQSANYLAEYFQSVEHKSTEQDLWTFILKQPQGRVWFTVPMNIVQDDLDPEQRSFFRNHKKGKNVEKFKTAKTIRNDEGNPVENAAMLDEVAGVDSSEIEDDSRPMPGMSRPSLTEEKLDFMMETMQDEMRATRRVLEALVDRLVPATNVAPEQPAPKPARKKLPVPGNTTRGAASKRPAA